MSKTSLKTVSTNWTSVTSTERGALLDSHHSPSPTYTRVIPSQAEVNDNKRDNTMGLFFITSIQKNSNL